MHDKLLLFVGDWLVIEAEGTTGILAGCLIAGFFGLLSSFVILARLRMTKSDSSAAGSVSAHKFDPIK